jgi:hypothetical protein
VLQPFELLAVQSKVVWTGHATSIKVMRRRERCRSDHYSQQYCSHSDGLGHENRDGQSDQEKNTNKTLGSDIGIKNWLMKVVSFRA